jgi:ATP-dependent DNA helicase RecQ
MRSRGRDVFALLPTGGGKSLCFQLPALLREGLTVVVSPLIALMKDQVDGLTASGIPATFLNSTLGGPEAKARFRGLHQGEYRLLYLAPERLMLSGFLETLKGWPVAQIAIDEAHCVSEWGHDFRPEYRQLAQLRGHFPDVPVMALTATATDRVRADIIEHLELRDPCCYVASFNRPNLTYRVVPKAQPYDQALEFLRGRQARERHHLLPEPQVGRERGRTAGERRSSGEAVSRGPHERRAGAASGDVSARRDPRDVRDDRLRHGHQ